MEKARISIRQLFVMIIIFELGSSLLITPGLDGGQGCLDSSFIRLCDRTVSFLFVSRHLSMLSEFFSERIYG